MFNLIKMDLHRLIHSVSTWVLTVLVIGMALFCVSMTKIDLDYMENDTTTGEQTETPNELQIGFYSETNTDWVYGKVEAGDMIATQLNSRILLILCTIFAAVFVNAEQKNGFIKNIGGQFPNRGLLAISKLAVTAFQILIMLLAFAGFIVLSSYIYFGSRLYLESVPALLKLLGVQYLLHLSFAVLIAFLSILTKSSSFSMVPGILLCSGFGVPLYSLVTKGIHTLCPSTDFQLAHYALEGNITAVGIDTFSSLILQAVITGCAFLLISVICSMLVMQKRDI